MIRGRGGGRVEDTWKRREGEDRLSGRGVRQRWEGEERMRNKEGRKSG
jgi:hypothetical protein